MFAQGRDYSLGPDYLASTDMQGYYTFQTIPEGTWYMDINDQNYMAYNQDYASQWYNGRGQMSTADPIVIAGGDGVTANAQINRLIPTFTILVSSNNPVRVGQRFTYIAAAIPVTHGGMMIFKDNGQVMPGCAFTQFSSMAATCTTPYAQPGMHSITATWTGDSTYKPSTSNTVTVRVLAR